MITINDFLLRSGYSQSAVKRYQDRLAHLFASFPGKQIFSLPELSAYCANKRTRKQEVNVIIRYLRLCSRLAETNSAGEELPVEITVSEYLRERERRNMAANTLKSDKARLKLFQVFLESHGITDLRKVDRHMINSFRQSMFESRNRFDRQTVIRSQNITLYTVQSFFRYLVTNRQLAVNPALHLRPAREPGKISRNHLSREEMNCFLESISTETVDGFFDRTVFELFYATGARRDELRFLEVRDINLEDGFIFIRDGKGGKDRVCPLTPIASRYLKLYLSRVRPVYLKGESGLVFPSQNGKLKDSNYFSSHIKKYRAAAGIEKKISIHAFRRSFATHLLEQGVDIRHIQRLMGHESINSTRDYIKVTARELHEALIRFHPREKKLAEKDLCWQGERQK